MANTEWELEGFAVVESETLAYKQARQKVLKRLKWRAFDAVALDEAIRAELAGERGGGGLDRHPSKEDLHAIRQNKPTPKQSAIAAAKQRDLDAKRKQSDAETKGVRDTEKLLQMQLVERLDKDLFRLAVTQGSMRLARMAYSRLEQSGCVTELFSLKGRAMTVAFTCTRQQVQWLDAHHGFIKPRAGSLDDVFNAKGHKAQKQAERLNQSDKVKTAKWKDETDEGRIEREAAEKLAYKEHGSSRKSGTHRDITQSESQVEKWERYFGGYVPSDLSKLLFRMENGLFVETPIDQGAEILRMESEWENSTWQQMGYNLLMLSAMQKYWKSAHEIVKRNTDPSLRSHMESTLATCDLMLARINSNLSDYKRRLKHCETVVETAKQASRMLPKD